jgi:hypothetical protein
MDGGIPARAGAAGAVRPVVRQHRQLQLGWRLSSESPGAKMAPELSLVDTASHNLADFLRGPTDGAKHLKARQRLRTIRATAHTSIGERMPEKDRVGSPSILQD